MSLNKMDLPVDVIFEVLEDEEIQATIKESDGFLVQTNKRLLKVTTIVYERDKLGISDIELTEPGTVEKAQ